MRRLRSRVLVLLLAQLTAACASHPAHVVTAPAAVTDPVEALRRDLTATFSTPPAGGAIWGVRVESLDHPGEALFSLNAEHLFVPASNMKLLTVAAAADRLGWDRTFPTTIRATTALDPDGTIRGDLVVRGTGDPTIGNRPTSASSVTAMAEALWQRGVRRIEGRVIGDDDAFLEEPLGEGWAWDDLPFGYSAPVGPLIYNENTAALTIVPGLLPGTAAAVALLDVESGLSVEAHVTTGAAGSAVTVEVNRPPGSTVVRVTGSIPADQTSLTRHVAVENPTRYFASALRAALIARGIRVVGRAADIDDQPPGPFPQGTPVLLTWPSPSLAVIATRLLKVSQNLYAETLLRELGAAPDHQGSAEDGEKAVRATLEGWGVPHGAFTQADGSGLSRYNLVSPSTFVQVLTTMYRNPRLKDAWMTALPLGGADGTLGHRLKGTPAEGRVHAKTGSLSAVRTLSGYVQTSNGEWLVFSIVANNFADPVTEADVEKTMDEAVVRMVMLRRN